jgi:regulator of replication initiation timing
MTLCTIDREELDALINRIGTLDAECAALCRDVAAVAGELAEAVAECGDLGAENDILKAELLAATTRDPDFGTDSGGHGDEPSEPFTRVTVGSNLHAVNARLTAALGVQERSASLAITTARRRAESLQAENDTLKAELSTATASIAAWQQRDIRHARELDGLKDALRTLFQAIGDD